MTENDLVRYLARLSYGALLDETQRASDLVPYMRMMPGQLAGEVRTAGHGAAMLASSPELFHPLLRKAKPWLLRAGVDIETTHEGDCPARQVCLLIDLLLGPITRTVRTLLFHGVKDRRELYTLTRRAAV